MPRSIWSGAISFGLVNVPVKLYSAVSRKTVRFHQLHDKDGVRIQQKRVCPADGEEVAYENIVKGYEISPERYVVIEPDTLDEVADDGEASVSDREVEMAQQLIGSLTAPFEPEKYHDEYRERVLELIEAKAAGEEISVQPPEEPAKEPARRGGSRSKAAKK